MKSLYKSLQDVNSKPFKAFFIALLLLIYFGFSLLSIKNLHVTYDESYHLTRGMVLLETGDFRINVHHPYLGNLLIAIPTLFDNDIKNVDQESSSWDLADKDSIALQIINDNGGHVRYTSDVLFAPRILQTLLTGVFIIIFYLLISKHFNAKTAIIASLFLALSPTFIAHGHLVTTDIQTSITIFLATFALYLYIKRDDKKMLTTQYFYFLILALVALLTKYTAVVVAFLWLGILFATRLRGITKTNWRQKTFEGVMLSLLTFVLLAISLFVAYGAQLKSFADMEYADTAKIEEVKSELSVGRFADLAVKYYEELKLPMPYYIKGFTENVLVKNEFKHETYLLGKYSDIGPHYHLVAFGVKESVFLVVSTIFAGIIMSYRTVKARFKNIDLATFTLFAVPAFIMALAMVSTIKLGIRHILPVIPFTALLVGYTGSKSLESKYRSRTIAYLYIGFLFTFISLIYQYPHYISYFNEFALSPRNGYMILHDSNLDWNQNELYVYKYLEQNKDKNIIYNPLTAEEVAEGNYYLIRLTSLYGDPFWQSPGSKELKRLYDEGNAQHIDWIANTHWLLYIGEDDQ